MSGYNDADKIPAAAVPIGTIVASLLPPEVFEAKAEPIGAWKFANADVIDRTPLGDFIVINSNRYAPALLDAHSDPVLPDLRGVFLRGMEHDGTGTGTRVDNRGDTESGRRIGSYQRDSFLTHHHKYLAGVRAEISDSSGNLRVRRDNDAKANSEDIEPPGSDNSETRPRNVTIFYYVYVGNQQRRESERN